MVFKAETAMGDVVFCGFLRPVIVRTSTATGRKESQNRAVLVDITRTVAVAAFHGRLYGPYCVGYDYRFLFFM